MIRLRIEGKVYKKMKHDDFWKMTGDYIDGSLTEENRIEFEAHMASCTDCKRIFQEQKTAADKLEMLRAEAPAGLLDNALKKRRRRNRGKWIPAIASAAAAIAVFVGVSLAGTGGSSDYADVKGTAYDTGAYMEEAAEAAPAEAAPWQRDVNEEEAPEAAAGVDEQPKSASEKNGGGNYGVQDSAEPVYLYFEKGSGAVLEKLENEGIPWEDGGDGSCTVYADDEEISGVLNEMIGEGMLRGAPVAPGDMVILS